MALMLLPRTADAQSIFVSGGGFANIVRASHFAVESPIVQDDDPSGTTSGWVITAGGALARHAVLQFEVAGTRTLHKDFEPARPLPPLPPPRFETHRSIDYRTRQVAVLGGYTTGIAQRVSASALFGLMFVEERTRSLSTTVPPPPPTQPQFSETIATIYRTAPVFGFDLPIRVAPHVALLPQVRVYKLSNGPMVIWPGASARVDF